MKTNTITIGIIMLILIACTPQAKEPVVIGALFPLTGGLSQYGEAAQTTAALAVEEINAAGGINGRPLVIDYQDHQCNAKTAVSIFEQLSAAKKVRIFTSAACSGTVLSIAPLLESKGALLFGTLVSTPKITGVSPWVFRNWASDSKEAKLFADEILKKGYKKVGVIHEQTDYAQGLRIYLEKFLNGTGVQVHSESFEPGATDVRTQLAKLKDSNLDLLFISPQTVPSGDVVLKQMQELNFKPPMIFVNDNIIKASDLLSRYAGLLEGAFGGDYSLSRTTELDRVMEKYRQKYGRDCPQTNICAGIYDAVNLLAQAIAAKGEDAAGVRDYLKSVTYEGVSGRISFDENNDRSGAEYSLFVVKDGKAILAT